MAQIGEQSAEDAAAERRLQEVFELYEAAEILMRENLRRRHPDADDSEIEARLNEWRVERPGAPLGDASGPDFRPRR